jgi:RsiW-degrading membrane proteinase PrsW (M82 family)
LSEQLSVNSELPTVHQQMETKKMETDLSRRQKQAITIAGLLLALPGLLFTLVYGLVGLMALLNAGGSDTLEVGLVAFTLAVVTLGAGGAICWHGLAAQANKPTKLLRLPPVWAMAGLFGLTLAAAWAIFGVDALAPLAFPPLLWLTAALPPLLAVAWFAGGAANGLTWRRGLVAMAGGATVGVLVAVILEIVLPAAVMGLVFDLSDIVLPGLEALFEALAGANVAQAITGYGFVVVLVHIALIAPVAEELAKPLIILPLLKRLTGRETFLMGAMAGVGFAALENVIYAGFGFDFWGGVLLVRALGGAIHPLGAGLVALGWRAVLRNQAGAGLKWLAHFGLAAGMHALWNGGSLLVITLAGAEFFGDMPAELDLLGLSAAGTTLALLVGLGLAALWLGRAAAQAETANTPAETPVPDAGISDRAAAIWALACLAAVVPAGIAGLQLLGW